MRNILSEPGMERRDLDPEADRPLTVTLGDEIRERLTMALPPRELLPSAHTPERDLAWEKE